MNLNQSKRKFIFFFVFFINFIAILIYNILTPLMSDDLLFNPNEIQTFYDLLKIEFNNYMTWNGRAILQFIMHIFLLFPKYIFNICNSLCFILLIYFVYYNTNPNLNYDFTILTFISIFIWIFGISFDQTILWLSGACNYLWGITIILGFLSFYRHYLSRFQSVKHSFLLTICMFFMGLFAGWCNENTSGGGLLLVLYFTLLHLRDKKTIKKWMISGILGMTTGLLLMISAPGNFVRKALNCIDEEHTGILAYAARFLKINHAVTNCFLILFVLIIFLLVYFILKNHNVKSFCTPIAFIITAIATSYVLIIIPQPMKRAYFGAGIFLTIALMQLILHISKKDLLLSTIKYSSLIILLLYQFFSYCENGANLIRIYREITERDILIQNQISQNKSSIILPQIRPEFKTKYSFIYDNDISSNPNDWGNKLYCVYYGVDEIIGIPRNEWDQVEEIQNN